MLKVKQIKKSLGAGDGIRTHDVLLGKQNLSFLATSFETTRSASLSRVSGDREASTLSGLSITSSLGSIKILPPFSKDSSAF